MNTHFHVNKSLGRFQGAESVLRRAMDIKQEPPVDTTGWLRRLFEGNFCFVSHLLYDSLKKQCRGC